MRKVSHRWYVQHEWIQLLGQVLEYIRKILCPVEGGLVFVSSRNSRLLRDYSWLNVIVFQLTGINRINE